MLIICKYFFKTEFMYENKFAYQNKKAFSISNGYFDKLKLS